MSDLPPMMPVAVYRGQGEVAVEQRPVPDPGPGQILAEVDYCGICGSDLHLMVEGWGKPGLVGGHEWSGVVRAVGPQVTGWSVGDVVVGGPSPRCGRCRRCREGKPSQCTDRGSTIAEDLHDGAFAQFVLANTAGLLRVPEGLGRREAALAEPLAVALHGITRGEVGPDDSVMVTGAGPIGALSVAALVARGLGPVTVVEPNEGRRRLALDLGAARALSPDELPTFPPWEPDRIAPDPVDVVLECSGRKDAIELAFNQLGRGGTLVMVGAGMQGPTFDPNRMLLNELTVRGSFIYDEGGFEAALALLASGAIDTDRLIEPADVPLEAVGEALAGLASGRTPGKVMVVPAQSPSEVW